MRRKYLFSHQLDLLDAHPPSLALAFALIDPQIVTNATIVAWWLMLGIEANRGNKAGRL
jgi:hypothetical protein